MWPMSRNLVKHKQKHQKKKTDILFWNLLNRLSDHKLDHQQNINNDELGSIFLAMYNICPVHNGSVATLPGIYLSQH